MRAALPSLLLSLLLLAPARAEEENLGPTPHATPEAAMRKAESRGWKRSRDAEAATDADVVGAITRLPGDRIGFMPLLQHHMAVEHWFLEGGEVGTLADAAKRAGGRCFVRLRGKLTLLGVFGGGGLEWYGTGLQHGRDWGPVMGYHERIYRFVVEEVVRTRTREEHAAAQRAQVALSGRLKAEMDRLDYAAARKTVREVWEGTEDAGFDARGLEEVADYLHRMLLLEHDPVGWAEADKDTVAETLGLSPFAPYRELGQGARAKLIALVRGWPEAVRQDLAPRVIEAWEALEYRHQRDKARAVLLSLATPVTEAFEARLQEAEANVEAAKARLEALQGTDDYAGMLGVLEAVRADQDLVLDYALADSRTGHWVPAARRLAALQAVMGEASKRADFLIRQIRETVQGGTGLPNSHARPRYNPEVVQRFAPRLTEVERERVETWLLGVAQTLDVSEDWKQVLLVAELLAGFGGDRAKEYFPVLLRRTKRQPKWQREHLRTFAEALGVGGGG